MADDDIDLTQRLPRGAIPSSRAELAAATPHVPDPKIKVPPSFLMWPTQMSSWNNYVYGDCVSAEEAFAKATASPRQTFIPLATVVAWAKTHGYLNGATLSSVLTTMETKGFPFNGKTYDDGPHFSVNWTNAATLQSAIYSHGPVKIGVGAEYFQTNTHGKVTPGTSGWTNGRLPAAPDRGSLREPLRLRDFGGTGQSFPPAQCHRSSGGGTAHGPVLCDVHLELDRDHRSAVDAEHDLRGLDLELPVMVVKAGAQVGP